MGDESSGPLLEGFGGTTTVGAGSHSIGELIYINLNIKSSSSGYGVNLCLKEIRWEDRDGLQTIILGQEYLGHGVYLIAGGSYRSDTNQNPVVTNFLNWNAYGRTLGLCVADCDTDAECAGDLICYHDAWTGSKYEVPGCTLIGDWTLNGNGYNGDTHLDFCIKPETDLDTTVSFQESPTVNALYLPTTPYRFQINTKKSYQKTMIDLTIHICGSHPSFTLENDTYFGVTISGRDQNGDVLSSDFFSLKTGKKILNGEFRSYALAIPTQFSELNVLTFSMSETTNDMTCIDEVVVNHKETFLTETFLAGKDGDCEDMVQSDQCPSSLYAVVSWPICGLEIMDTRFVTKSSQPVEEDVVLETCENPNRLFSTDCEVSTTREVTNTTESSLVISSSTSTERTASVSRSTTRGTSWDVSMVCDSIQSVVNLPAFAKH